MSKHTPGEMFVDDTNNLVIMIEEEPVYVATTNPISIEEYGNDEANAAELARRWNAFPALVEACKIALDRLLRLGAEDEPIESVGKLGPCPACEAIRAALAAAEGKS